VGDLEEKWPGLTMRETKFRHTDVEMIHGKKIVVVMPAFNAEKTLTRTYSEIPLDIVDDVIVVDDHSRDDTVEEAKRLGIKHIVVHENNCGYGANQKSCYQKALSLDADIVVMVHPDYQYTPKLIPSMAYLICNQLYPVVLGSRILGRGALKGGMPIYKYLSNRILTGLQNILLNEKLSEYHTGYRAYSREVLETINFEENSDDFVFDNEILSQILYAGFSIAEITCPTKYFPESSSINFSGSVKYGLGVLRVSIGHFLQRAGLINIGLYKLKKKHSSV
jgi:glycosyltransferase involved in cell wall biosynthesis